MKEESWSLWLGKSPCFMLLALSTYSENIALLWLFKVPKLSSLKIQGKKKIKG